MSTPMVSPQIAQLNVGRACHDRDDPRMDDPRMDDPCMDDPCMDGFMGRLDEINALADCRPGFVWRLRSAVCRYDGKQTACLVRQTLCCIL
jgi:hypothetical protein